MNKERFEFVCSEAKEGRDAFVNHQANSEEGLVLACSDEHMVVRTSGGRERCWDFRDCEEISRGPEEWPRR